MEELQGREDPVISTRHSVSVALEMEMFVRPAEINLDSEAVTERTSC